MDLEIIEQHSGKIGKLLTAKYMPDGYFFNSKLMGSSQFWPGLHKVKHLFQWDGIYRVGNGSGVRFWKE